MAKHIVKCKYCGMQFDASLEPFVKISNRYAHKACSDQFEANKTEEERNKEELEKYIKELFSYKTIPQVVYKQMKEYVEVNKYTYTGILKSLKFYYEVKHGDKEKAHGRIGIVPYIYEDAKQYYFAIWQAQQENASRIEALPQQNITIPTVTVTITSPARKPLKHKRKLFAFLEEGES